MPNWVINKMTFSDNDEKIKEIISYIKSDDGKNHMDFNKIIPMPENIFKGNLGDEEIRKYGKNNWLDWSIKNWGTKWNSSRSFIENNEITFKTAWSAPIPIFKKLTKAFPNTDMKLIWADEGMGYNIGKCIYENGELSVEYYDVDTDGNLAWEIYIELWGIDESHMECDKNEVWHRKYQ